MKKIFFLFFCFFLLASANLFAQVQWASKLIDFSSEYKDELIRENSTRWSAAQVLGYPNTMKYGQSQLAWTPSKPDNVVRGTVAAPCAFNSCAAPRRRHPQPPMPADHRAVPRPFSRATRPATFDHDQLRPRPFRSC